MSFLFHYNAHELTVPAHNHIHFHADQPDTFMHMDRDTAHMVTYEAHVDTHKTHMDTDMAHMKLARMS